MDIIPEILFLGNGINRCFDNSIPWNTLLAGLSDGKYTPDDIAAISCPAPLKAILATGDKVDQRLKDKKADLFGCTSVEQNSILQKLLDIDFDEIFTTNYSYELEMAALNKTNITEKEIIKLSAHMPAVKKVEPKYLLHSYNSVNFKGKERHIWHIHGEARKPDSMILGHYYYANLLAKEKTVMDSRRDSYKFDDFNPKSWLDSFILGNVYIIGFGFDLSEIDLWWMLNRKKREKASQGKTVFYDIFLKEMKEEDNKARETRNKLLDMLNVDVFPTETDKDGFIRCYNDTIDGIAEKLKRK